MSNRLFILAIIINITLTATWLYSAQRPTIDDLNRQLTDINNNSRTGLERSNTAVARSNESLALSHSANTTAIRAHESAIATENRLNQLNERLTNFEERIDNVGEHFENEWNRIIENAERRENQRSLQERIQIEHAKIQQKQQLGIFEQEERIRAQASVDAEKVRWEKISDPKFLAKIVAAVALGAMAIYIAKHSIPKLIDHLTQPRVIIETSKKGWFAWGPEKGNNLDELIFAPSLHKQLLNLMSRIQSAKKYNENLPNILFYGPPGTGKTAFAKALAYSSGPDYALTSGSEFAKITDLNIANNELRKLLDWAQNSDKGLIVFIDEAESLFANRKLPTTPKIVQDFIDTFLALIPDKSQKNLMFIFATNHPFKLDDAITNRISMNIEFILPQAPEREKILATYLEKFSHECEEAIVTTHPDVKSLLPKYADKLDGLSPRAIKFVAQEMISTARRQQDKQLTTEIAELVLDEAKRNLQETELWEQERNQWVASITAGSAYE